MPDVHAYIYMGADAIPQWLRLLWCEKSSALE